MNATSTDLDSLLAEIELYLERGDKLTIAKKVGKTAKQVCNYFTRKTKKVPPSVLNEAYNIAIARKRLISEKSKQLNEL